MKRGFTLIELLIVIAIIGIIASIILASLSEARDRGKVAVAVQVADSLRKATELYNLDMGFYPPDVTRGIDPGLSQSLPWDPETGNLVSVVSCSHCPPSWENDALEKWRGPYVVTWPMKTPWGGRYDYNYWDSVMNRNGCIVPPGLYVGIQGESSGNNIVTQSIEEYAIDRGFDSDGCVNGEIQLLLFKL